MGNLIIFTYFDQKRSEEIFFVPFCLCLLSDILQKIQEFLFCQSIFALKKLPQKLCKNFICLVRCQILYQAYHDLILTVFRIDILLDQFYEILLYVIRISRVLCFAAEHFPEYRCSIFCPVSCYIVGYSKYKLFSGSFVCKILLPIIIQSKYKVKHFRCIGIFINPFLSEKLNVLPVKFRFFFFLLQGIPYESAIGCIQISTHITFFVLKVNDRIFTVYPFFCKSTFHKYQLIPLQDRSLRICSSAGYCTDILTDEIRQNFQSCRNDLLSITISTGCIPCRAELIWQYNQNFVILMAPVIHISNSLDNAADIINKKFLCKTCTFKNRNFRFFLWIFKQGILRICFDTPTGTISF